MDDIDISGIDDILERAARMRLDIVNCPLLPSSKSINLDHYNCKRCGTENSTYCKWCINCGLNKNEIPKNIIKPPPKSVQQPYSVFNSDHLLDKNFQSQNSESRTINSFAKRPYGEVTVFKFHKEDEEEEQVPLGTVDLVDSAPSEDAKSTDGEFGAFSEENVILYERNCNKKTRGKIIVKPIGSENTWATKRSSHEHCTKRFPSSLDLTSQSTRDLSCSRQESRPKSAQVTRHQSGKVPEKALPPRAVSPTKRPGQASNHPPRPSSAQARPVQNCNSNSQSRRDHSRPGSAQGRPASAQGRPGSAHGRPSSSQGRPGSAKARDSSNVAFGRSTRPNDPQRRPQASQSRSTNALPQRREEGKPSVFDRLYSGGLEQRDERRRRVRSSTHLIPSQSVPLKTSLVALSTPQLRLQTRDNSREEARIVVRKSKNTPPAVFNKQVCAQPLTISGTKPPATIIPLSVKSLRSPPTNSWSPGPAVNWRQLPTELWVTVMCLLPLPDILELSLTCSYLHSVSSNHRIWERIKIAGKRLSDECLEAIGEKAPRHLVFNGCDGDAVTSRGLRSLFRACEDSLKSLALIDCLGGEMIGSSLLLHLSARCANISDLHLTLCSLSDDSLTQLACRADRLERVCLPMCSGVSDGGFRVLIQKHYRSLTCLDITGCHQVSGPAISQLSHCPSLSSLYLGNCPAVSPLTLSTLAASLTSLTLLDVRGCRSLDAESILSLLRSNPHISTLSLAHLPAVTDQLLRNLSTALLSLRVLDLSGCVKITNAGVEQVVRHPLHALDLGSTGVSFKGCCAIGNYLSASLRQLSINFCSFINDECVRKIVQKCEKLEVISTFGCTYVKGYEVFRKLNPRLRLEF